MESSLGVMETPSFDILVAVRCSVLTYETAYESEDPLAKARLLRFAQCSQLTDLEIPLPLMTPCFSLSALNWVMSVPNSPPSNFSFSFGATLPHALFRILACVATIETLSIYEMDIFMSEPSALAPHFPQRLRNLIVEVHNETDVFFEHLGSLPTIPQLCSREFTTGWRGYNAPISFSLEYAGPALQSLKIWLRRSFG
jgi:hypothetical protein